MMRGAIVGMWAAAMMFCCGCAANRVEVKQYGQMHVVLSGGAAKAVGVVSLGDVVKRSHAFGVGALAGLEGEITVYDGSTWIARPNGGGLDMEGPVARSTEMASLMTVSYVEAWQNVSVDRDLAGEAVGEFISEAAAATGIDVTEPFPFVLDGELTGLEIHAINGACPMRPGAGLSDDQQPWELTIDRVPHCRVVGFYARDSVGKLTHAGTSIHAHALVRDKGRLVTGHVERMAIARGTLLMLPVVR